MFKTVLLIPAYKPDQKLLHLLEDIANLALPLPAIVVVNDGSGETCDGIFAQCALFHGCTVLQHAENKGKGAALRTGLAYIHTAYKGHGCITADADGQHTAEDIGRMAAEQANHPDALVLGVRSFTAKNVPFKSRFGNTFSCAVFKLQSGIACKDTQTGLRAIPACFIKAALEVPGQRYDYEMNLLTAAVKELPLVQLPIRTVYIGKNESSHFRPLRDSLLIYQDFARYLVSSFLCAGIDLVLFSMFRLYLFAGLPFALLSSTAAARVVSGSVNFGLNKAWVFRGNRRLSTAAAAYLILFVAQMLASWLLVAGLCLFIPSAVISKILADTLLFGASYFVQKRVVFFKADKKLPLREAKVRPC
ncbi:MAG: glycosyltransferase [Oscillospiraceae bacterium]